MGKYPRPVDARPDEWIPTRIEHPTNRANFTIVYTPHAWLGYSYETLIGVRPIINGSCGEWHLRKNVWGPTTGKHLNWLEKQASPWSVKPERLDVHEFKAIAEQVLNNDRAYLASMAKQALTEHMEA